jgi:hypothetical protein
VERFMLRHLVIAVTAAFISGAALGATNSIVPGQSLEGAISGTDIEVYEYASPGNEVITAYLWPTDLPSLVYWPVFDVRANGEVLASNANFLSLTLTNSGRYEVVVRTYWSDGAGPYYLSFVRAPGNNLADAGETNVISPGLPVSGYLLHSDLDAYTYNSAGNEWLAFSPLGSAVDGHPFIPTLQVIAADGAVLSSTGSTLQRFYLTNAGPYQMLLRNIGDPNTWWLGRGYYGLCAAHYQGSNSVDAGESGQIMAGETREGLADYADLDVYEYVCAGDEVITVLLVAHQSTSSSYQPMFDLIAPNGAVVATEQIYMQRQALPANGKYRFITYDLDGYVGSLGPQPYQITLIRHPGPNLPDTGETNSLRPGQIVTGSLAYGDLDSYEFDAIAGDTIQVAVKWTDGSLEFGPRFDFYGPGTALLTSEPVARLRVDCIETSGHCQIVCRDADFFGQGSYELRFIQTPGPPPPGSPPEHLSAFVCANQVVVRWSTNATGYTLQRTDRLFSPDSLNVWSNVPPPFHSHAGQYFVTNQSADVTSFFRLRRVGE